MKRLKYTCPCCGYKTLTSKFRGSHDICDICYWQDDEVQYNDPHFEGGANDPSLIEAQQNYIKYGAIEEIYSDRTRSPRKSDQKDKDWAPFKSN